jgi:hypothetical protein
MRGRVVMRGDEKRRCEVEVWGRRGGVSEERACRPQLDSWGLAASYYSTV